MIGGHPLQLQGAPGILKTENSQSSNDSSKEFPRIVVCKNKTVALTRLRVVFLYSISQPTNLANDRDTAITHRDKLAQATGLEARRHQEHITACVNALRQFSTKRQENCNLIGIACR